MQINLHVDVALMFGLFELVIILEVKNHQEFLHDTNAKYNMQK